MADRRVYTKGLLEKAMVDNPEVMNNPEGFIIHSKGVGNIVEEYASKFAENYPGFPLNFDELTLSGDLHDIGRPSNIIVNKLGQLCHEIESSRIIKSNGVDWGLGTPAGVLRIANAVRTHSSVSEQYAAAFETKDSRLERLKEVFGEFDPELLVQKTWQEAIITYGDLSDKNGEKVDPTWKLDEAISRYLKDPKIADPLVVIAHPRARNRLVDMCEKVEDAAKGKLTTDQVREYFGFL